MNIILPETCPTPSAARPIWAEPTPDTEGNHDGPTWRLGRARINLHSGWHPDEGATAWLDSSRYDDGELSPEEMEYLGQALLSAARLVREARAAAPVPAPREDRVRFLGVGRRDEATR